MIAVQGLRFGYRRDEMIIDGLDHVFSGGAVTAVSGPSGGGKSTLLYLLGLLLKPQAGGVSFDGATLSGWSDRRRSHWRARNIGFVFQDAALDVSRTVLDNVVEPALYAGLAPGPTRAAARDLLDRFGVGLRADHRPGEVSGGQAQRVALCRALIARPRMILADEPTGNLDSSARDAVFSALRASSQAGTTVVIATHDPALASASDERVYVGV